MAIQLGGANQTRRCRPDIQWHGKSRMQMETDCSVEASRQAIKFSQVMARLCAEGSGLSWQFAVDGPFGANRRKPLSRPRVGA